MFNFNGKSFDSTTSPVAFVLGQVIDGWKKGIPLIGKGGSMLKKVGTYARQDMEEFLQKKVFLEMFVKVIPDWRNRENYLKSFGYSE